MKLPSEKLDVKLIALDLDDTLLNNNREISDENVKTLQKAVEKGIYVVLCSGRAEQGILPFVRRLDIAGKEFGRYILAMNGCSVFDLHKREQLHLNYVDPEILLQVEIEAQKIGLDSIVHTPDVIYFGKETDWTKKDPMMCGIQWKVVENYPEFLKSRKFPKILVPGEPETLQILQKKLKELFGSRAVVFTSKPYFLEIMAPESGKGEGLEWLCNYAGIDFSKTIGFGDSMNDESMIRKCGYSVAMINGLDYIKECATFITEKTNDESGVGDFINKYII